MLSLLGLLPNGFLVRGSLPSDSCVGEIIPQRCAGYSEQRGYGVIEPKELCQCSQYHDINHQPFGGDDIELRRTSEQRSSRAVGHPIAEGPELIQGEVSKNRGLHAEHS